MNGVPRTLNRGVPIFHEGMLMSSSKAVCRPSRSSTVFDLRIPPGCVMTILNPPGSVSLAMLEAGLVDLVESDKARGRFK